MSKPKMPNGLAARGKKLWADLVVDDMPADQASLLLETCRTADRLDELNALLQGKPVVRFMAEVVDEYENVIDITISLDDALMEVRQQTNLYKQLLVTLRQLAPGAAQQPARGQTRGTNGTRGPTIVDGATGTESSTGRTWRD